MDYFSIKRRRRSSIGEDEERELEEYFNHSYIPPSNLPTPPLSSSSSPVMGPTTSTSGISHLLASTFLCGLIPQQQANIEEVASFISRANLDPNTVALAACILDSLSSSFVRSWRKACEKARSPEIPTFRSEPMKPELIVLGALALAHSYLYDVSGKPKWWSKITNQTMEPRDISATKNCILRDIDYGLMSFTMEDLEEKKQEMFAKGQGVRSGKAVFKEGQWTPDESPL
ncbi:Isocitrate dehydrogenase [NADP] [Venturia nashicola]|uniref:Isocitrate dehydrogenase [NADP] n=1 Tax=Venturia nashicola TaxID=86259 RepID=A0A4Z1PKV3_9PEZI|nr:Isocitrate dehydrogenase [NADP] [Venturia nashicola]